MKVNVINAGNHIFHIFFDEEEKTKDVSYISIDSTRDSTTFQEGGYASKYYIESGTYKLVSKTHNYFKKVMQLGLNAINKELERNIAILETIKDD